MTAFLKRLGGSAMALSLCAVSLSAAGSNARLADAAEDRDSTSIRLLLEQRADVTIDINAVDDNGETAMHGAAYKNLPKVVEFLAGKGADIEIWNQKNEHDWTPLNIAQGYRFGNFKPSPVTVDAILRVMAAAGVPPPVNDAVKGQEIY